MEYEVKQEHKLTYAISEELSGTVTFVEDTNVTDKEILTACKALKDRFESILDMFTLYDDYVVAKCTDENDNIVWEAKIKIPE